MTDTTDTTPKPFIMEIAAPKARGSGHERISVRVDATTEWEMTSRGWYGQPPKPNLLGTPCNQGRDQRKIQWDLRLNFLATVNGIAYAVQVTAERVRSEFAKTRAPSGARWWFNRYSSPSRVDGGEPTDAARKYFNELIDGPIAQALNSAACEEPIALAIDEARAELVKRYREKADECREAANLWDLEAAAVGSGKHED